MIGYHGKRHEHPGPGEFPNLSHQSRLTFCNTCLACYSVFFWREVLTALIRDESIPHVKYCVHAKKQNIIDSLTSAHRWSLSKEHKASPCSYILKRFTLILYYVSQVGLQISVLLIFLILLHVHRPHRFCDISNKSPHSTLFPICVSLSVRSQNILHCTPFSNTVNLHSPDLIFS